MKKEDFKTIVVPILIIILCVAYLSRASLAKYIKRLSADMDGSIASWNIKVNNESIKGKNTLTNAITPTFPETTNKNADVIAPGSIGYFDVTIDPSEVDVNFQASINISNDATTAVGDMQIKSYKIDPDNASSQEVNYNGSSVVLNFTKNGSPQKIRIYLTWFEGEGETMDNTADTTAATTDGAIIKVNTQITFTQVTT